MSQVKIEAPPESKIASVANGLAMGADVGSIRDDLLREGYTEYAVFLTVRGAEALNRMREKEFIPRPKKR